MDTDKDLQDLQEGTKAYYQSLSQEEREEQRAWAGFATAQAPRI